MRESEFGQSDQDLRFSREQSFFDKSKTISYLILLFFGCALFIFLHFREVRVEILDLNSIAPGFIVSQIDFDFPDDEATIILKQDAIRDAGKIYQISNKEVRQKRVEFENFLLYNQAWHETAEGGAFDELYLGLDTLEKALLQLHMTDERTIQKMKEAGFTFEGYQIYTPEFFNQKMSLPQSIWDEIQKKYFSSTFYSPLTKALLFEFFKSGQWTLEEDIPSQRALRKKIQAKIPEKMSHVSPGNRIVNQGERVTARHVAMLQAMKAAIGHNRNLSHPSTLLGTFLMTLLFEGMFISYLKINQRHVLFSNRKLCLLVTILVLTLGMSKLTELFLLNAKNNLIETIRYPLFVPMAAILICNLINPFVATFCSGFLSILSAVALAFNWEGILIFNLAASLVAILSICSLKRRKEIFIVCIKAFLCCLVAILALHLYDNSIWKFTFLTDILSAGFFLFFTAILVIGLLPLLESTFQVTTDVTLMEYLDPNNDLLRRLTIEAPGTYQHSVVVGNLAEAAALGIGANGLFCRVATLYHDVGKMTTAQYFTENQLGALNIHQLLTPEESAQVIMAHVPEGVALAREADLPEPIIDIIKEHHGTTLVYYFYRKQVDKMGGDAALVDQKVFRYLGPKPRSKESGIIMIADSFEAASRSLDQINLETLQELIDRLVKEKVEDGQFDDCRLTFQELSCVKKTLVKTLLAAGHSRIKYPVHEQEKMRFRIEESA